MSLFEDSDQLSADKRKVKAVSGSRDKVPDDPDFAEFGQPPRKGNPFALDDFSSRAGDTTTKP
jgi:hypothetical protein